MTSIKTPVTTRAGITIGSNYQPPRRVDVSSASEVQQFLLPKPADSAPDLRMRRMADKMHPKDKSVLIGCGLAAIALAILYATGAV